MASSLSRKHTVKITGKGVAVEIKPGFRPKKVTVWNETDATRFEWLDTMDDASVLKTVTAGTTTHVSADGVTPSNTGVTLGTAIAVNAKVLHVCLEE